MRHTLLALMTAAGLAAIAPAAAQGHPAKPVRVINPSTYAKLPYDPMRDLVPITSVGSASFVLVTHPSLAVRDVRELVALAKRRPGELTPEHVK